MIQQPVQNENRINNAILEYNNFSKKYDPDYSMRYEEIIFAPKQGRRFNYIKGTLRFNGYRHYSLSTLLDTGVIVCSCREIAIPIEFWEPMKYPIKITGISVHKTTIQNKAKNVEIWFNERKFVIPKLLCFPDMHGDLVLGNNFIEQYLPMIVEKQIVSLQIDKLEQIKIPLLDRPRYKCSEGFSPKKTPI